MSRFALGGHSPTVSTIRSFYSRILRIRFMELLCGSGRGRTTSGQRRSGNCARGMSRIITILRMNLTGFHTPSAFCRATLCSICWAIIYGGCGFIGIRLQTCSTQSMINRYRCTTIANYARVSREVSRILSFPAPRLNDLVRIDMKDYALCYQFPSSPTGFQNVRSESCVVHLWIVLTESVVRNVAIILLLVYS
jgi:hypothetical protein